MRLASRLLWSWGESAPEPRVHTPTDVSPEQGCDRFGALLLRGPRRSTRPARWLRRPEQAEYRICLRCRTNHFTRRCINERDAASHAMGSVAPADSAAGEASIRPSARVDSHIQVPSPCAYRRDG